MADEEKQRTVDRWFRKMAGQFAMWLQFQPTNNAEAKFLSSSFVILISSNYGLAIFKYYHIAKP